MPFQGDSTDDPDVTSADMLWTDHRTGETFAVDPRTGNSYPVKGRPDDNDGPNEKSAGVLRRTLSKRPCTATQGEDMENCETPKWLEEALGV